MAKVTYDFDPFEATGIEVSKDNRESALEDAASFIKEQILSFTGDGKTSVASGAWRRQLTKGYAKIKGQESSADFANLELTGDLLDALQVYPIRDGKIRVEISGDQAGKAEGNLLGTYGQSKPIDDGKYAREFMPQDDQDFRREIISGLKDILGNYEE